MTQSPRLGKFDSGTVRAGGRNIDTWTYRSGLPGQAAINVKVNLVTLAKGQYTFTANCEQLEKQLQHADLNELRRLTDEALHLLCTDAAGLSWEDWLEVRVVGEARQADAGAKMALSISYAPLKRAVLPDGRAVTINRYNRIQDFPTAHQAADRLNPDEMVFDERNSGTEISYIPSTPDAIASLQDIQARLDQLRLALNSILTQSQITTKLADLAKLPLQLTAPKADV